MTIGALLDLGIDVDIFLSQLKKVKIDGYRIEIKKKQVNSITGTDFNVIIQDEKNSHHNHNHNHPVHRNLNDIERIIEDNNLKSEVKDLSKKIFKHIALAEAKVHDKSLEEVHFHEVGAVDSIVDILGTAICISMLKVSKIYSSPLHLGTGFIECAHGVIPVPAPATVEILKDVPVYSTGIRGELVTPTGAAIIKSLADDFSSLPQIEIEKTGYGTGKKTFNIPNVLRIFLGKEKQNGTDKIDKLMILETNIDDINPEIYSYLVPLLFDRGALDVFLTNIIMKKGRPAVMLSVLCEPDKQFELENIIFTETTTLGIRRKPVDRRSLDRKIVTIETQFGKVSAKLAYKDGKLLRILPEYEECQRIAEERSIPLKEVYNILIKGEFKYADK